MQDNGDGESRRGFLKASAVGTVLGTTGCLRFAGGNETDTAGTETREQAPGEPASAQFQFSYDADAQAVTITVVGDTEVAASDLQIRGGGRAVAWSTLGSTGVAAGDTLGDGATVTVGPDVGNWETAIGPDDTVRVVYLGGDSPTTVAQYTPPESAVVTTTIPPTEAATPTRTETPVETPTETEPDTESETETDAAPDGQLTFASPEVRTLDPIEATDDAAQQVVQQVFDALLSYQDATTTVENRLATTFAVSDDFTTYTFTLADATFHDGRQVTAADVEYSFERLAQSDNSTRSFVILDSLGVTHDTDDSGNYEPDSLGVTAVDDRRVRIELDEPFHPALEVLASTWLSIVPEGIVGDIEGYSGELTQAEFSRYPVGSGPFELAELSENGGAVVVANADYYYDGPDVGEIRWVVTSNATEAYQVAMNGAADVFSVPDKLYEREKVTVDRTDDAGREIGTYGPMENDETANYAAVPRLDVFYIGFNMEEVPKPIRQAVAYVVNQTDIATDVFEDRNEPAYHITPPTIYPGGTDQYTTDARSEYPYGYDETDTGAARQLVEDAGYSPNDPFTFTLTQYNSDTWNSVAQRLQQGLSAAYVEMEIEEVGFGELLSRGRNGELEAYTLGWEVDWPDPQNFMQLLYPPRTDPSQSGSVSFINWSSDTGDAASDAASAYEEIQASQQSTEDAGKRRTDSYIAMERANWEDVGLLPIYHQLSELFWYDAVEGFTPPGAMGSAYNKLNDVGVDR